MVKISTSRASLRKRQGSKMSAHTILLLLLGCIVAGFVLMTYSIQRTEASPTASSTAGHTPAVPAVVASDADSSPKKSVVVPANIVSSSKATTVAYAVSITGCGSDPLSEGAAVLAHSIHQASVRYSGSNARYDYKMYAIVHPDGMECGSQLAELGYTVLKRETPVAVKDIQGEFLRTHIEANGCCGEKELIKLEAYTLVDHPIVVHMDLDTLVLKPLDHLFDLMLGKTKDASKINPMWDNSPLPEQVNAFFTRDYNMVHANTKYKPVQGGFLVLRPSMDTYKAFVDIVREGDFRKGGGWGGKVGPFYGSMTFQGIIPYYYDYLHPGSALEVNRCVYNQMCDNPRDKRTVNDVVSGNCRIGKTECEDCRSRPLEDVITNHFTLCQKPWWCLPQDGDRIQERLCRKLHGQWYRIRSDLEISWGRSGHGPGRFQEDQFHGYCKQHGKHEYIPIAKPFGQAADYEKSA